MMEAKQRSALELIGSLGIDEIMLKPKKRYLRNNQVCVGDVDMAGIVDAKKGVLATRMLAFVFRGLSTSLTFPVGYFFVNQLTTEQLAKITRDVIKKVEEAGFKIIRLVADNASVNTKMFRLLDESKN